MACQVEDTISGFHYYLLHFRYTHSMICSVSYGSSDLVVEVQILVLKARCCVHVSVCMSIKYHQEWQIL